MRPATHGMIRAPMVSFAHARFPGAIIYMTYGNVCLYTALAPTVLLTAEGHQMQWRHRLRSQRLR